MRSRLRPLLATACLLAVVGVLVGCTATESASTVEVDAEGQITFGGYVGDGKNFTVQLTNARPKGKCINDITYMWDGPGEPMSFNQISLSSLSTVDCPNLGQSTVLREDKEI